MWLYHLYWALHDVEKLFAAPPKFDVVHVVHVTDRTGIKEGESKMIGGGQLGK